MNKKVPIQDIKTTHHRSIQDISMADIGREEIGHKKSKKDTSVHRRVEIKDDVYVPPTHEPFNLHSSYSAHSNKPRWGMVGVWFLIIVALLGVFAFVSSFFYSSKVNIKIKEVTAEIEETVNMVKKSEAGVLSFEIMSLSKELSESVPTNGEKQVSVKATGKVVIYNKNTVSQKLLNQTRLEAPNGKIYRITSTVTVGPAKKSGSSLIPGSLLVNVVADAPGEAYNLSLTDFTIPGFKGTAKYQTVYGLSKTPISGGASGTVKVADVDDLKKAEASLVDLLNKQFLSSVDQQVPNTFILLPNIYSVNYSSSTQETTNETLTLKKKADFVGVLVDSKKFSSYLAKKLIPGYGGEDIMIDNISDLTFEYDTSTTNLNVNTNNLSIKIKGKPHFVYGYDAEKLKTDLMGLSRESFASVIATYPGIEKGNSKIEPFWRSKFPTDLSKITINEEN